LTVLRADVAHQQAPGPLARNQQILPHAAQQGAEMQQLGIGCVNGFFQGTINGVIRSLEIPCSNQIPIFTCESGYGHGADAMFIINACT
jgi:stringent starvation protein B